MKPIRVFIMANGDGDRWIQGLAKYDPEGKLPKWKQAVTVGDEMIFHRTIRMLTEVGIDPEEIMVVGPRPMWKQPKAERQFKAVEPPGESGPLLEGVKTIFPLWESDRTVVLLGDVVFSYRAINGILKTLNPIMFLGRPGPNPVTGKQAPELFGFSVAEEWYGPVLKHCERMTARGAPIRYPPKLWALYRLVCGFEHDEYKYDDDFLVDPLDYTDDLDSVEEYRDYWPALSQTALADAPVDAGIQERAG